MADQLDIPMCRLRQHWAYKRCRSDRQIRAIKSFGPHSPSSYSMLEEQTWTPDMQFAEDQYVSIMAVVASFKNAAIEDLIAKIGELNSDQRAVIKQAMDRMGACKSAMIRI
jgi:hypothetical protein